MRKSQNIKNRFLGILFVIFTIAIGAFALSEIKIQSSDVSGNLGGKILTKFKKDTIYMKFSGKEKKTNLNELLITKSINKIDGQKDSLISSMPNPFLEK